MLKLAPFVAGVLLLFGVAVVAIADSATNAITKLGEGRLRIGAVTVDPRLKAISFPAAINMTTGMVEYVIVTTGGKVHESLLRTAAEPFHIHTAMLLLGAQQTTNVDAAAFFDGKRAIPGAKIRIELAIPATDSKWESIQKYLANAPTKTPLKAEDIPHWIYNGSKFSQAATAGLPNTNTTNSARTFLAQREGSIVSLIADPAALVNNPRPDRENDELWTLHTPAIPPVNTPVEVRFVLE